MKTYFHEKREDKKEEKGVGRTKPTCNIFEPCLLHICDTTLLHSSPLTFPFRVKLQQCNPNRNKLTLLFAE